MCLQNIWREKKKSAIFIYFRSSYFPTVILKQPRFGMKKFPFDVAILLTINEP